MRPGHRVTGNKHDHFPGTGWEFVRIAIDDASCMAYAKIMPDEKIGSVTEFLREALAHFASFGIRVGQLMSDNGPAYRSQPVAAFLHQLGIEHIFTWPYTPRTNGKAERFIQTGLREWAYAVVYQNSAHRQQHLQPWLHRYNWHRPHSALKLKTPVQSLNLSMNNVLRLHTRGVQSLPCALPGLHRRHLQLPDPAVAARKIKMPDPAESIVDKNGD